MKGKAIRAVSAETSRSEMGSIINEIGERLLALEADYYGNKTLAKGANARAGSENQEGLKRILPADPVDSDGQPDKGSGAAPGHNPEGEGSEAPSDPSGEAPEAPPLDSGAGDPDPELEAQRAGLKLTMAAEFAKVILEKSEHMFLEDHELGTIAVQAEVLANALLLRCLGVR